MHGTLANLKMVFTEIVYSHVIRLDFNPWPLQVLTASGGKLGGPGYGVKTHVQQPVVNKHKRMNKRFE